MNHARLRLLSLALAIMAIGVTALTYLQDLGR